MLLLRQVRDGRVRLFEINPRVGGDLGTDVPRESAVAFLAKLDALATDDHGLEPHPASSAVAGGTTQRPVAAVG